MRLTIVVPCYNEERRLAADQLRGFSLEGVQLRFLLVDDGSRDGTLALLRSLGASAPDRFRVLALERNGGKAEAVRRGIQAALAEGTDLVGFWDADLATPLAEIPGFLEAFARRPDVEMVFGARVKLLGRSIVRHASRHYLGRVGATLISLTLGIPVYDTQCGAKLFRVTGTLPELFGEPFLSRWLFDVEIIARLIRRRGAAAAQAAIYELPVRAWHDVRGSKVGPFDFLRSLGDLWKIRRAYFRGSGRLAGPAPGGKPQA